MKFLICLLLVSLFCFGGSRFIKKHANLLYVLAGLLAAYVVVGTFAGLDPVIPHALKPFIWEPLSRGSLGSAFFVLVMFAGAVKTGSPIQKTLMPIRAEMSIIASILTLGHNIAIGKIYFVNLVTNPGAMPLYQLLASICSIVMLAIMLPLFITSFPSVRKKMNARSWKKLQRLAYGFYALMYVHSMLLFLPKARNGNSAYLLNVAVFTVIFMVYGAMRIMKAMDKNKVNAKAKYIPVVAAVALAACVSVVAMPRNLPDPEDMMVDGSVSEDSSADASADTSADASQPEQPDGSQPAASQQEEEEKQESEQKPEEDKKPAKEPEKKPEEEKRPSKEPEKKPEQKPAEKPQQPAKPAEKPAPKPEPKPEPPKPAPEPPKPAPEPEKPAPKPEPPAPKPEPEPEPPKPTTKYKDGTFTGSAQGYNGPVTVKVTIQNDKITGVSVVSHTEDEPFWSEAKGVINKIVASNSANVDSITGATTSSDAIKSAVKNAMSKAKN